MRGFASAPASSANLGPGFDTIGLALDLRCRVEAKSSAEWRITQEGDTWVPEPEDFVRRAVHQAVPGPFHLEIDNAVPRTRGLGSSAAVAVAAAAAALRASGSEPESLGLFELASAIDGHPDNAAAAVYGGLVAVLDGAVRRLELSPALAIVVGIPDAGLSTSTARAVVPETIGTAVAARSLARLVFLVEGLRTGDAAALGAAGGDELHEEPRQDLSPVTSRLVTAARAAGALHAAWSGAGPTAIAFVTEDGAVDVEAAMTAELSGTGTVRRVEVAEEGWR